MVRRPSVVVHTFKLEYLWSKLANLDQILCVASLGWGKSKKINNEQELIQSDPISCPQTKREITEYINWRQFTKGTRGKQNEQLFPK